MSASGVVVLHAPAHVAEDHRPGVEPSESPPDPGPVSGVGGSRHRVRPVIRFAKRAWSEIQSDDIARGVVAELGLSADHFM